jgi:hypothetical protein
MLLAVVAALVMAGATLLLTSAGSDTASAAAQPRYNNQYQDIWAGWGAQPRHGVVTKVVGSWRVPAVKCSSGGRLRPPPGRASRAAPWVGIWGPGSGTDRWLAQAGTESRCENGELKWYKAWTELYPYEQEYAFDVQPGDRISAYVMYLGRQPDGRLKFVTDVYDEDKPQRETKEQYTTPNAQEVRAAKIGGCIVERQAGGGLAKFTTPIRFEALNIAGAPAKGCQVEASLPVWNWRYVMTRNGNRNGTLLAKTGLPNANSEFSVSWKAWN